MAGFFLGSLFGQALRAIWGPDASDDAAEAERERDLQSAIYEDAVASETISEDLTMWDSESAGRHLAVHFPEHFARMHALWQLAETLGTSLDESTLPEEMLVSHDWELGAALTEFLGETEADVSEREDDGDFEMPEAVGLESEEAEHLKRTIVVSLIDVHGATTGAAGGDASGQ